MEGKPISTTELVAAWFVHGFHEADPNAALSYQTADGGSETAVVEMVSQPSWDPSARTLTAEVTVLDDGGTHNNGSMSEVALFIDDAPASRPASIYEVVTMVGRFAMWPADRELPLGWSSAGFTGDYDAAVAWINDAWEERRPAVPVPDLVYRAWSAATATSVGGWETRNLPPVGPSATSAAPAANW